MSRLVARIAVVLALTAAASSLNVQAGHVATVPRSPSHATFTRRSADALGRTVAHLTDGTGATVAVSVVELGGGEPMSWSVNGSMSFTAASTYKLAVLMLEAERIASGGADPNGLVCYAPSDYEPGWFDDYVPGACFTRGALAARAGLDSDNTAGLMLLDDVGGIDALNRWAATAGATSSSFAYPNVTTADDLTHLWVAEAAGRLGGAAAQGWLYPMLTGTTTESGIPAGVGPGALVVHKTGSLDPVFNDTALVRDGPDGPYVVTVLTDGLGQDAAWPLIASISKDVWEFESAR